jgi:hypothetical protein
MVTILMMYAHLFRKLLFIYWGIHMRNFSPKRFQGLKRQEINDYMVPKNEDKFHLKSLCLQAVAVEDDEDDDENEDDDEVNFYDISESISSLPLPPPDSIPLNVTSSSYNTTL